MPENRFIGKTEKVRTLVTMFEDHNQKMRSLVGQEFEKSTLQRYETALMHTKDFMQWQHNVSDIPITKIFTQSLRFALAGSTSIKVYELLPHLVDTELSKNIGGNTGIPATEVAAALINGMENDLFEIAVGQTMDFRDNYFPLANAAFELLNPRG